MEHLKQESKPDFASLALPQMMQFTGRRYHDFSHSRSGGYILEIINILSSMYFNTFSLVFICSRRRTGILIKYQHCKKMHEGGFSHHLALNSQTFNVTQTMTWLKIIYRDKHRILN